MATGKLPVSDRCAGFQGSYRLGLLLVTASAVAWSTAGLFTRLIAIDTGSMLVWRGMFGAAGILVGISLMQGGRTWGEFRRMGWAGWMFVGVSALGMLCFITSLRITTVAHVSIIYATVPLVAAGLAWLVMRERPAKSAIVASLVAVGGVSLMVGWGQEGDLFGDLLAFGMTVSMAVIMVISRHTKDIPIMPAACLSAVLSSLVALPWAGDLAVSAPDLGLLALFGLVNSALGLGLFAVGARMLPAIETALLGALDAPLAPIWVWIAFAETPGLATMTGGGIVFAAIAGHLLAESLRRTAKTPASR
ncbi:MAG: drug/metabolite transporter (DMT)-like permease [Paracoccaceae bacterium]|jgi:drug/metabolite transporter (DMT)-like permease